MYIYKVIATDGLEEILDPRIFHNRKAAIEWAKTYENEEVDRVTVYEESPTKEGYFRTTGRIFEMKIEREPQ